MQTFATSPTLSPNGDLMVCSLKGRVRQIRCQFNAQVLPNSLANPAISTFGHVVGPATWKIGHAELGANLMDRSCQGCRFCCHHSLGRFFGLATLGFAHLAALGLVSMMLHDVIVKTVELVGFLGMPKTSCSGETRRVLHEPSSS